MIEKNEMKLECASASDETSRPPGPGSIRCGHAFEAAVSCEVFHVNDLATRSMTRRVRPSPAHCAGGTRHPAAIFETYGGATIWRYLVLLFDI